MHRSLFLLSKLRLRGHWRRMKRSLKSPLGALMGVAFVGSMAVMVLPRLLFPRVPGEALTPMTNMLFHPAMLFVLWISTLVGSRLKSPIAFSMPEVDFLFAGPFTRRTLLEHKLLINAMGPLGFAILAPLALPFVWWPAALAGVFLAGTFMQWWTILLALLVDWIGSRYRALRWALAILILSAIATSIWNCGAMAPGLDYIERLKALEASWASRIILAPFVVFSRVFSAQQATVTLVWAAGALAMVLAVGVAILKLDGYFVGASLEASRRRHAMLERLKRTGGTSAFRARSRPQFTLPHMPRLGGAGPIACRQALDIVRSSGGPLMAASIPAVIGLGVAITIRVAGETGGPMVAVILAVTMLVGFGMNMMPMGIRTDLDHLEVMKTLPLAPYAIVFGSVAFAVAYVTLVQTITLVSMAAVLGSWYPTVPLTLAIALPVNLLTMSFDGLMVLLFPSVRRFVPGDPLVAIRIMLVSMGKVLFALASVVVAAVPFGVARLLGSTSLFGPLAVGFCLLIVEGLIVVAIAALLFERFDPSKQMALDD